MPLRVIPDLHSLLIEIREIALCIEYPKLRMKKILGKIVSQEMENYINDDAHPSNGLDTLTNYCRGLHILP